MHRKFSLVARASATFALTISVASASTATVPLPAISAFRRAEALKTPMLPTGPACLAAIDKGRMSPLVRDLLIYSPRTQEAKPASLELPSEWKDRIVPSGLSTDARWEFIRSFPLRSLIANPGHRVVRRSHSVEDIALNIIQGRFRADSNSATPAVNLITDSEGHLKYVDAWEGHHRMLGYLAAGRETVGDLGKSEMRVFINGELAADFKGHTRPHMIPPSGVDFKTTRLWVPLEAPAQLEPGQPFQIRNEPGKIKDLIVSGKNSNILLGSRETLGSVLDNIASDKREVSIGVWFLDDAILLPTPDYVIDALKKNNLKEIVFVRRSGIFSYDEVLRIENLQKALLRENAPGSVNAYVGPTADLFIKTYELSAFLARIRQAFLSTREVKILY